MAERRLASAAIHKPLAIGAHLLILAAAGYVLFGTVWFFVYGPTPAPQRAGDVAAVDQRQQEVDVEAIVALDLFGKPPASGAPVLAATEQLEETQLSLVLVGVFAADDGTRSSALIARKGRAAELYRLGDRLPGNAKLAEVHGDRVVITRGSARELVRFPKSKAATPAVLPAAAPAMVAPTAVARTAMGAPEDAGSPGRGDLPARLEAAVQAPLDARELAAHGVSPAGDGGYLVGALADRQELRHAGLKRGDRILSVNGRPLGDPEADWLAAPDVLAEGAARLEIQRGDRQLMVTVALGGLPPRNRGIN